MALDNPSYFSMVNPPAISSLSSSVSSTSSCSSPGAQSKRSLRSLLRSFSTNSADSNHELFSTGAPRLSDIAPEFKYASEPRRAHSLKVKLPSGLGLTDVHRLYSPLPSSETDVIDAMANQCSNAGVQSIQSIDSIDDDHEDEVFVTREEDTSVRYYNLKTSFTTTKPRRHSISTLRGARSYSAGDSSFSPYQQTIGEKVGEKEHKSARPRRSIDLQEADVHASIDGQTASASSASRIHLIDEHKLRHGSYPRKRCNRCPRGVVKRTDMEDILIISAKDSEPANLWALYFVSYFEQISQNANRKPYKIRHLGLEEVLTSTDNLHHITERAQSVKLQLIILCPQFLEQITENSKSPLNLPKLLLPDRILALQLGTSDEDITDLHKEALPSYLQWQRRSVGQDQDQNFTHEFVGSAIAIFTKIWKQQSSIATEENSQFSIAPKKIRYGQTSVLIMLEYPLLHEDIVKISIVKNEEMAEIKNVKRRNPYTLKFTIPEKFLEVSAIVNILVEKNGSFIGKRPIKCESRLRELEQILRSTNNPVEFMCQSLGFSPHDSEQLDNWLVYMFQKNVPPNFNLFANNDSPAGSKHVCELFPTLLHFSARFGLEKLTSQLLDCPGGDLACEIRNVQDFSPADIAENVGHKEINTMLKGYMKMNELATVYSKIKKLTGVTSDKASQDSSDKVTNIENSNVSLVKKGEEQKLEEEEHYLIPKKTELLQMDDFYKMCPAPKPVNFMSKSAPTTPLIESSEDPQNFYIAMDQTLKSPDISEQDHNYQNFTLADSRVTSSSLPETRIEDNLLSRALKSKSAEQPSTKSQSVEVITKISHKEDDKQKRRKHKHHSSLQSIHSKKSSLVKEDKVQVELAEIINDFKNNVHTIAQTEQLVAEWQNRNDVQKSFKEKQDQLKEMRLRYEQIQRDMKHNGKKSSPFERFKKIFGFAHHNSYQFREKQELDLKEGFKQAIVGVAAASDVRPISSLSLQSTASSASSGTMSTISGCSLGDSGTHSDHDERKIILAPMEEDIKSTPMSGFNNYLIPPTPRPVKIPLAHPPNMDNFERLDPFYIHFPPNGLPISPDVDEVDTATSPQLFTIHEHMSQISNQRLCDESEDSKVTKTESEKTNEHQEYMNLPSCSHVLQKSTAQHDYMNFKAAS